MPPATPASTQRTCSIFAPSDQGQFYLITQAWEIQELCEAILTSGTNPPPVLGLDCEGLCKNKPLSLLQLSFRNKSFIFDLLQPLDPFDNRLFWNLRKVMNSPCIKIFHDFCEDGSALINQYGIFFQNVFDT